ncbi:hypothetical protein ACFE04_023195 [Oxalis oulophora]
MEKGNSGYFAFTIHVKDPLHPESPTDNIILLRDQESTVFDLKFEISRAFQLKMDMFDIYYNDVMLDDDQEKLKTYIPEKCRVEVLLRVSLKVQQLRGDQEDVVLHVNNKWTVRELKTKLRDDYNFPSEFELQHPDEPGNNLDDTLTMVSVGLDETSNKLITIETKKSVDSDS